MLLACATSDVEQAMTPSGFTTLEPSTATTLCIALTVLARSPTLAHVLGLRSLTLTRLTAEPSADYHLGNDVTGLQFRPIDRLGRAIPTTHTRESLMSVVAVLVLAVGNTRAAAEIA